MENTNVKAIVLGSRDWKENDKLVTLFTLERGIITAILKGVSKPNSKLKFAKEPFCFAEFLITEAEFPVIASATLLEPFFELAADYEKYVIACEFLKTIEKKLGKNNPEPAVFVLLLKALKHLTQNEQFQLVELKFLLSLAETLGYKLNLKKCCTCKSTLTSEAYIDFQTANLLCPLCKNDATFALNAKELSVLSIVTNSPFEKLDTIKFSAKEVDFCLTIFQTIIKNI